MRELAWSTLWKQSISSKHGFKIKIEILNAHFVASKFFGKINLLFKTMIDVIILSAWETFEDETVSSQRSLWFPFCQAKDGNGP